MSFDQNGTLILRDLQADKKFLFDHGPTIFKYFARSNVQIKVLELGCGTANNIAFG